MTTTIFDLAEFKPLRTAWVARQQELKRRHDYWTGEIYAETKGMLGWLYPRLQGGIRPLYLPLARAVNVDAGVVPGGWKLAESALSLQSGMQRVWAWSDWSTHGILYTHYGALFGTVGMRIADLRAARRVVLRAVSPQTFMLVSAMQYDAAPKLALTVEILANPGIPSIDGETFEYAEVIERDRIRTFADGTPTSFDGRDPEYANELGFVPFIEVPHINSGEAIGDCAFQRTMPLLDEVNKVATWLAQIIQKNADPQWAVIGSEDADLTRGGENVWYIPGGGDVKVLVPGIDIAGVLKFLQEIRSQVEASLPELAFDDLRSKDQIATETVELQLMELTLLIKRVRPNYDAGLVKALRMCGRAAASMLKSKIPNPKSQIEQELVDVARLADGEFSFDSERAVLPVDPVKALEIKERELRIAELSSKQRGEGA